jgi:hypothetical protein|tara:strand:+ start:227 stop:445 length:219 start_codon:yes stop_codon:yes gene_type:complete
MHDSGHDYAINYVGGVEILTHPLYVKRSAQTFKEIKADLTDLKAELEDIQANMDNLALVSYLSTLIRISGLI